MIKQKVYFDELDGLRCFAVLLTMMAHWFPAVGMPLIPYSWKGVDLFFIISGFLITLILFKNKDNDPQKLVVIKKFFIRRSLRIFPVYYIFILFFFITYLLFHAKWWEPGLGPYLFTYTSNIYYQLGGIKNGVFEHTWSLAVEEQFYLVWPWIICFVPSKKLPYVIVFFVLIGIICNIFPDSFYITKIIPAKNFNTLCSGGFFAYLYLYCNTNVLLNKMLRYRKHLLCVCALAFILLYNFFNNTEVFQFTGEFVILLIGLLLVINTVLGWGGIVGRIFKSKPIKYIGKISYGLYLFHMPVPLFFALITNKLFIHAHIPALVLLSIYFSITIVIASFSYTFLESKFLKLKNRFS
jgi:peptidoglycan/LPS O-acetylase OafA/YrhL